MPKRLRCYLEREPRAISAVLHILLRVIEAHLRRSSDASSQARFGTVSFIHRFGASLNRHVHYHCCVIDGVFEPVEEAGDVPEPERFRPAAELTPEALAAITDQVRIRVLRWFARSGLIERDDVREMLAWENSGFSLDAAVCVGTHDRAGLERLDDERIAYRLPKPQRDGTPALTLTPLDLIDHLAALIPPPRRHRHRYHGVLAPNAPLRAAAIAFGREVPDATGSPTAVSSPPRAPASNARSPARYLWAMLLARLFESLPLVCPNCGADMRLIAFITEAAPFEQILTHIGEPPRPPPISPARGPPAWYEAPEPMPDWDLLGQPEPDFEFDQRVSW